VPGGHQAPTGCRARYPLRAVRQSAKKPTHEDPKGEKSFLVAGKGTNGIMSLSDENMNQLLKQTYDDFLLNMDRELEKAGF
jgi:hypothetical protein